MSNMKDSLQSEIVDGMENEQRHDTAVLSTLSKQERRVFMVAEQDPLRFATSTAAEIGEISSTSEATVVRTAQKLGYSGLKAMKLACTSAFERSQSLGGVIRGRLAQLPNAMSSPSPKVSAEGVLHSAADLLMRFSDSLEGRDVSEAVDALTGCRRVGIYGLGTAYRIAQYFSLELERIGIDTLAMMGSGHLAADAVHKVSDEDALVVLAPLAVFPDVRKFLTVVAQRAGSVILVSQDEVPDALREHLRHIRLPRTSGGAASESVAAWALCDVLTAEVARRYPERAIETRSYVQQLRDTFSSC